MPNISIQLTQEQLLRLLGGEDIAVTPRDIPSQVSSQAPSSGASFMELFRSQILRLKLAGSHRTRETYASAYTKLSRFLHGGDVGCDGVTADLMQSFQAFLRAGDLSLNTVSFYMRIVRAVYHRAVERGLTEDRMPFAHVYTGIAATAKRAVSADDIRRVKTLRLEPGRLAFARDMFLFSLYTRGMSFVDMAYLRKGDIRNGVLTYRRRKTGQLLSIRWERGMQEIVDRHPAPRSEYLLPIIRKANGRERNQYRNRQTQVNADLKQVAAMAGIERNLTMYCARHSWASIARKMLVPVGVISRGMGHTSERTTEIYLQTIDARTVDQANRQILESL